MIYIPFDVYGLCIVIFHGCLMAAICLVHGNLDPLLDWWNWIQSLVGACSWYFQVGTSMFQTSKSCLVFNHASCCAPDPYLLGKNSRDICFLGISLHLSALNSQRLLVVEILNSHTFFSSHFSPMSKLERRTNSFPSWWDANENPPSS